MTDLARPRLVLGYAGTPASAAALRHWLDAGDEVIAVTVDVGQARDVDEIREQALAAGARRAHVFDLRDEFVREHLLPALRTRTLDALADGVLTSPLVERKLLEVAAIEQATRIDGIEAFDVPADPERRRRRTARTLLERPVIEPPQAPATPAHVAVQIEAGVPVAVNGVPLEPAELLESLAVIAGPHGIGRLPHLDAPALPILHAAYATLGGGDGVVAFELLQGHLTVRPATTDNSYLVNHA